MMVVNGLTTVYCNTPSLHLNSNTLPKKRNLEFSTTHLNSIRFSPKPRIKTILTNDAIFIFNSFNLVILSGKWGRRWTGANKLKYYFKNYLTATSSGGSPFCV